MSTPAMDWLANRADRHPDATAIVEPDADRTYSYADLDERASRLAEALADDLGLGPGDRVALLASNGAVYFEAIYGCWKSDTRYVGLNWRLTPSELEHHLRDAEPRVLVYDRAFEETVEALRELGVVETFVATDDPLGDDRAYEALLSGASGRSIANHDRGRRDTWGLLYTSGTTGLPKGVEQTADMVIYNHLNIGTLVGLTSEDTVLTVLPCFHTGGLNLYANPALMVGGTVVVPRTFDPEQTLDLLEREATVFFGVPAIYKALINHPTFAERDLSGVRSWSSGGARLPVALLERYAEHDIVIRQGMGMTETGPTLFLIDEAHALEKAGSIGMPSPFVETRVVDPEASDLVDVDEGELLVRGPGVTPGYWRRPEANASDFVDGWLRTGDVARVDEDGHYYLVDRLKNMFISGGENVYPAEIERVLHDHPAVDEAAVVAVDDERWGEVGRAFVVPIEDGDLDADDVLAHCRAHLAGYKVPKHVTFLGELPRTPAGNVERGRLRER
ncbi:MAG: class I adenylate-forming enzyme family protein [Halobacteriales archaeon]